MTPHPRVIAVTTLRAVVACFVSVVASGCALGGPFSDGPYINLPQLNRCLKGRVDDYTANHGCDYRFFSPALGQKRDVYVYVPPGYDPELRYPIVYWMHGFAQDEKSFLEIISFFDKEMAEGKLPKSVMVAADGSPKGRASYFDAGTFYLNSPLGNFEDYIVTDIWNHVVTRYSIRPEREAHVLAGASMGGFGAYNLGIKHRKQFGVVIGIMPPLNTRYSDCHGRTRVDFDPNCFELNERYRPFEPVARFYGGLITIRKRRVTSDIFGEGPDVVQKIAAQNPAEMLTTYDVKPGELEMFAGYGSGDEFNFDAHVQSFAYMAKFRGIEVKTVCIPGGGHNRETGKRMLPDLAEWIRPRLEKYAPK